LVILDLELHSEDELLILTLKVVSFERDLLDLILTLFHGLPQLENFLDKLLVGEVIDIVMV
jgi:hypothetical protein